MTRSEPPREPRAAGPGASGPHVPPRGWMERSGPRACQCVSVSVLTTPAAESRAPARRLSLTAGDRDSLATLLVFRPAARAGPDASG